ncbi:heterokaryon incompatibility protein-domain-containing protein [Hyaloscypha finlandica]|nr:heterokaryon incompatibility protein-domain-containing protein [Hyaloscypha finlandica]
MFHWLHEKLKSAIAAPSTSLLGQGWLCDSCTKMIKTIQNVKRPLKHSYDELCEDIHQPSIEGMCAAAAEGCGICSKLVRQLDRRYPRWHEEIGQETALRFKAKEDGSRIELWFTPQQPWPTDGLFLTLICYNAPARAFEADIIHEADTLQSQRNYNGIMLARRWLESCLHTHPSCATSREVNFMPPRILDLRNDRVRLVEDTQSMTGCSYVALSHCWGVYPTACKLNASNRSSFCTDIPEASLPQTFKDAVFISRALGFQWLWIDSLCIIQNSPNENEDQHHEDWQRHIAIMDRIYQNCVVNVTAADGDNPTSGCIGGADAGKELPCIRMMPQWTRKKNRLTRNSSLKLSVIDEFRSINDRYDEFIKLHLHTRGWVVQERLLSPRTIHFTKSQTFWECSKVPLACEDFPLCIDVAIPTFSRKGGSRGHSPFSWKSEDPTRQHGRWLDILEDYTRRSLTRPVDRLPAIAGIASRANSVLKDTYRAGHFKSKLLHSLLWQCTPISASEYRAPSWSWASMEAGVNWDRRMTTAFRNNFERDRQMVLADLEVKSPRKPKAMTPSTSVIDMQVELVDPNNEYGQVWSGFITLNGPFVEILWSTHVRDSRQDPGRANPYTITFDVDNLQSRLLSLAFDSSQFRDTWTTINLFVLWHDDERMIESGLIIVEKCADFGVSGSTDLGLPKRFVRVGVFKSSDDEATFEEWSNPLFERYTHKEVTIF